MSVDLEIKESFRQLLLPISAVKEDECIPVIKAILSVVSTDESVYPTYIKTKYEIWKQEDKLDPHLKNAIEEALKKANAATGSLFSEKYFHIHKGLAKNPLLSFDLATILLSHLRLIYLLASGESMSCAKIMNVLKSIDKRLSNISWKDIQFILGQIKLLPELNLTAVTALYADDEKSDNEFFADDDLTDASYQVGLLARSLYVDCDAEGLLNKLSEEGNVHLPYLQILHYQCLITAFYDHDPSRPYEFAPRGTIANWLFSKWNDLTNTSNPVLNNLKAVDILDENWAGSKNKNEIEQAFALVELLKGLGGLGFSASQELSAAIRRWLIRYIKIKSSPIVPISVNLDNSSISKVFHYITSGPTASFGILEQRFVDAIAATLYPGGAIWRQRGLSDAVNSNNLSKQKLGDCDFQDSATKKIVAFEAHGGILAKIYFESHVRTLRRSLYLRMTELENIADIDKWEIKIIFVAYGYKEKLPSTLDIIGVSISFEYLTFNDLLSKIDLSSLSFTTNFNHYFIEIINNRRTPSLARDKIKAAL